MALVQIRLQSGSYADVEESLVDEYIKGTYGDVYKGAIKTKDLPEFSDYTEESGNTVEKYLPDGNVQLNTGTILPVQDVMIQPAAPVIPDDNGGSGTDNGFGAQTPGPSDPTTTVDVDLGAIPKGAEFWDYEGNIAIVYRIPGDPNATPLRYTATKEDLIAIFGPVEADNITFTTPSKDDWDRSLVFGNSVELYDPSIIDPTRNPWESFVGAVEKQAAVRPWLKSEEMLYLLAESTLEGRTVTDAEWESTEWWRTHTQAEREWLLLAQQVNPDTGEVMTKDALEKVYDDRIKIKNAMVSAGIFNLTDDLVNWVSEKFTTGQWSGTYTDEQIKLLADPQLPGDIDTGMQTFIDEGGVTFDTTRAGEQQVKDLVSQWWGPIFGANVKDSQIEQWAGMLRNDPNGEIKLIDKLKASRKSLFPEYDEDLTYEEIASPWRGFVQNAWGQNVDDASDVVQEVIKLNDTVKAGQYLFKKGLEDNVAKPTQEALKAMSQAFGSGQRGRA